MLLPLLLIVAVSASPTLYPATAPEIHLNGRHYLTSNAVLYDWPCFRIAFCFQQSTKVEWLIEDTWNIYDIVLDTNSSTRLQP
jgi:hypothetical protein